MQVFKRAENTVREATKGVSRTVLTIVAACAAVWLVGLGLMIGLALGGR